MGVGQTIRYLRQSAGLKQSELADRLEVSANYISLVENDRREPSLPFLRRLSEDLGVPLGLLFLGEGWDDSSVSPEEKAVLTRIKGLILEIERMRLHSDSEVSDGA
jgi:transcriptional regulator with XRE-family HTH domain